MIYKGKISVKLESGRQKERRNILIYQSSGAEHVVYFLSITTDRTRPELAITTCRDNAFALCSSHKIKDPIWMAPF